MVKLFCILMLFCCSVSTIATSEKKSCVSKCMDKYLRANTDEEMDEYSNKAYGQELIDENNNKPKNIIKKICNCFKVEKCKKIPHEFCE